MEKREYVWFVKPMDSKTNRAIAREVIKQGLSEVNFNKANNLWECTLDFISSLRNSKQDLGLNFRIYNKEGTQGKIRDCTFLFKKRKKTKAVK